MGRGEKKGFRPEPGKFIERKFDKLGCEKEKHVCDLCYGICCSAVRDLMNYFLKRKIIPAKPEVRY